MSAAFDFPRWCLWVETLASKLTAEGKPSEARCGREATPKNCCSVRVSAGTRLGQFDFWETGEADYDVMDATSKIFFTHKWGSRLSNESFEAGFMEFLQALSDEDCS